jgi:hypothetical protein
LLPGMGRSNRRHHQQIFRWTLVFGLIFSLAFAYFLYLANR